MRTNERSDSIGRDAPMTPGRNSERDDAELGVFPAIHHGHDHVSVAITTIMTIYLHLVAVLCLLRGIGAVAQGQGWFAVLMKGLAAGDFLPVIGVSTATLVIFADGFLISLLRDKMRRAAGDTEPNASPDLDSVDVGREHTRDAPLVDTPLRIALWAIVALTTIALGGMIFTFSGELAGLVKTWPNQFTIGAVVIGMALILSAAILSSFLMLTARLNAVSVVASEAEEVRRHVERAKAHLATIARRRGPLRSPG